MWKPLSLRRQVITVFSLFAGAIGMTSMIQAQQVPESDPRQSSASSTTPAPLVVPIYPRLKPDQVPKTIEDLKDSYIVLDDGSVVSMADWVLGSLNKSEIGSGMSDYQSRLFLGQVARAVAGLNQDLIYRSFEDAGPARPFVAHTPSTAAQITQGLLSYFIPALRSGWEPIVPEPGLARHVGADSGGTIQFGRQFDEAVFQSSEDFIRAGRMLNMLRDADSASSDIPPEK